MEGIDRLSKRIPRNHQPVGEGVQFIRLHFMQWDSNGRVNQRIGLNAKANPSLPRFANYKLTVVVLKRW
jgi:hypothetical protein